MGKDSLKYVKCRKDMNAQTENTEQNHADQGVIVDPECLIKHPLQSTWTLWYQEPDRIKSWEDTLNEVTRFSTVEDFWSLLNHIKSLADNKIGSDYSLFKKDIRLMGKTIATSAAARGCATVAASGADQVWLDCRLFGLERS
ncbi:eukaryotic translation initiation factor 4E1-like [Aedes albopictus]|uniref:Uncharacterized protein n=1 Tax=Aedes albopictus TaxID=7160 RepID=A0ABM1YVJ9_AEDAL